MAYFQRRRGKQVTIYYHDPKTPGKPGRLSRDETEHMDAWSDDEINAWLTDWEKDHGREVRKALRSTLSPTDELAILRDAALADWQRIRPIRAGTLLDYRRYFAHAENFFVKKHSLLDVRKWDAHMQDFPSYLRLEVHLGVDAIKQVCRNLTRFGRYLRRHRLITSAWDIEAPKTGTPNQTPLKIYLTTEQVLQAAAALPAPWSLVPLLGYFGPLRPEEIYALELSDFLVGEEVARQSLTHKRLKKYGMGTKLCVSITKTLTGKQVAHLTKTHYAAGTANVWSAEGAKAIGAILKTLEPGRLFPFTRDVVNDRYKAAIGTDGLGAKDWSRMCGVEFRLLDVSLEVAKDQFRHSSISTTQRYMRIPAGLLKDIQPTGKQDFDDVV